MTEVVAAVIFTIAWAFAIAWLNRDLLPWSKETREHEARLRRLRSDR